MDIYEIKRIAKHLTENNKKFVQHNKINKKLGLCMQCGEHLLKIENQILFANLCLLN